MKVEKIKQLIKICPYKEEKTKHIEQQFCTKYNKKCFDMIHYQQCERFKRLMEEEMKKAGYL